MASPSLDLLEKIAEFLVFRYYVLCPHCASPNVLGDDERDRESGPLVCWSCRQKLRFAAGDVREYRPASGKAGVKCLP